MIKPTIEIPKEVIRIHGINNEIVKDKKYWIDIKSEVEYILKGNHCLIYNKDFDTRMIKQTSKKHNTEFNFLDCKLDCVMEAYSVYKDTYYYTSLPNAYDYAFNNLSNTKCSDFKKIAKSTAKHMALGGCLIE